MLSFDEIWHEMMFWGVLTPFNGNITQLANQGGSGKDLSILHHVFSKNKGLWVRKRSLDAINIFLDTYDLPLHPPKRLERYATSFIEIYNGLVATGHVDISKSPSEKTPFWAILDPKKSHLLRVCANKKFSMYDGDISLVLEVALDVRGTLEAKKCVWGHIKKS